MSSSPHFYFYDSEGRDISKDPDDVPLQWVCSQTGWYKLVPFHVHGTRKGLEAHLLKDYAGVARSWTCIVFEAIQVDDNGNRK
jgi:hypothetical protein